MSTDTTRDRILSLIATAGPITAASLAEELHVTSAGVRRHLLALIEDDLIEEHDHAGPHVRGRGRPARAFVATHEGQQALASAYANVAVDDVDFLRDPGSLNEFVEAKAAELERTLAASVPQDAPMGERVDALAVALGPQHRRVASMRSCAGPRLGKEARAQLQA